jgi:signal transduction histidine kinase
VKDELGGSLLRRSIRHAIERRRISEEKERLERRLHQAGRMESLVALSAGIGFGFNNILGTIFDHCDEALAALDAPGGDIRVRTGLLEVRRAAARGAEMVTHLRDYSRPDAAGETVDLSRFVLDASALLDAMVPRRIDVAYDLSSDPLVVEIGRLELQRVLMSLIVNAAEAIGGQRGSIAISTGTVQADETLLIETQGWWDPRPVTVAFLRVADSGSGIDPHSKDRIFEPFYSTRFAGRGLGLAGVLGILQRWRAVVRVDPRAPRGTVFTLLFPQPASPPAPR